MKSKYLLVTVIASFLLISCEDFLERPPKGVFTDENFFLTPDAGFGSVVKCYKTLNDFYGYEAPRAELGNMATDDSEKGGSDAGDRPFVSDLAHGRATASNQTLSNLWATMYTGIGNCNICLENIPTKPIIDAGGVPVTKEVKARYIAEVKFLRAFYYFELAKIFGGVPLVVNTPKTSDGPKLVRATENETFLAIMKDLDEAAKEINLPSAASLPTEELGRVTREAVWAMQARVYMYFAKDDSSLYAKAKDAAFSVIDTKYFELESNFQSLFLAGGYRSKEGIFTSIRGDNPALYIYGSFIPLYTSPRGPSGAWGFDQPTKNLVDEFEPGDPRLLFTIIETGDKFETETLNFTAYPNLSGYHNRKSYLPPSRRGAGWGDDAWSFHIIRYADVLLMYAEALLQTGGDPAEVAEYINKVRRRANNSRTPDAEASLRIITIPNTPMIYVTATDDLMKAIQHERRVELAMEYNRLYDLKRWNVYVETMNAFSASPEAYGRGSAFKLGISELFPIPQTEIDRSQKSIKQNFGY